MVGLVLLAGCEPGLDTKSKPGCPRVEAGYMPGQIEGLKIRTQSPYFHLIVDPSMLSPDSRARIVELIKANGEIEFIVENVKSEEVVSREAAGGKQILRISLAQLVSEIGPQDGTRAMEDAMSRWVSRAVYEILIGSEARFDTNACWLGFTQNSN